MKEEKIFIKNGSLTIEGLLHQSSEEKGVIICHPHSLMGGSMYNNVVEAVQKTFAAENISTVRFNFRGVGGSTGFYSEGVGEQEDIVAVNQHMKTLGLKKICFAGYSFGAWVGSKVIGDGYDDFLFNVLISPPIDYFEFDWNKLKNKIDLIVCGDEDQFCSTDKLIPEAKKINTTLEVIRGADHFYFGEEEKLMMILQNIIVKKT